MDPRLQHDLLVCQRELLFSETELEAARRRAREADEQHRREVADLQKQVRDLSERVSTAYHRGSQEGVQAQRELQEAQSELGELCSEVMLAQAESEFAEAVHAPAVRDHREAREIRSRAERAERVCQELAEERQMLESALPCLTDEIRQSDKAHALDFLETEAMEDALRRSEHDVACYEKDFRELHGNLRHVLETLREKYVDAQREKMKLEERVASLERARSPRLAATRRMTRQVHMQKQRQNPDIHEVIEQPLPLTRPAFRQPLPPRHAVREAARQAREDEETQRRYEQQLQAKKVIAALDDKAPIEPFGGLHRQAGKRSPASFAPVEPLGRERRNLSDGEFSNLMESTMSDSASPAMSSGKRANHFTYHDQDVSDTESNTSSYWQDPTPGRPDDREMRRLITSSTRGRMPK